MKKLIQGIVDFRQNLTKEKRELFAKLALGQKPHSLFIACSDSRVVPNLFASTNPGDLFVLRNIGNLVPPFGSEPQDHGSSAVLEFAVHSLNVFDIIICGHSECGAMKTLMEGAPDWSGHLKQWLKHGEESLNKVRNGFTFDPALSEQNRLSQVNVLQQMEHIASYPFVQERLEKGELRLHGWWFDIAEAQVHYYEKDLKHFVLIDEEEGRLIPDRLGELCAQRR